MKFTIVIPTYNGSDFIEEALLSAINQTRKADEIIISDDNSTDNTLEICQKYNKQIKIYKNPLGPSGFVNGWKNAINKVDDGFISILHQDDCLNSHFLEIAEKILSQHPNIKHFFVPCNYINEKGCIIFEPDYCDGQIHQYSGTEYIDAYQMYGHPHVHRCPGVITHKSIFKNCTYRKEAGHIADDDFFYRVGQFTDVIGYFKPLASYRLHSKSETGHLENSKLVTRLLNDYAFQLTEAPKNKCIKQKNYQYIIDNVYLYLTQEYVFGLIQDDQQKICNVNEKINLLNSLNISIPLKMKLYMLVNKVFGKSIFKQIERWHLQFW